MNINLIKATHGRLQRACLHYSHFKVRYEQGRLVLLRGPCRTARPAQGLPPISDGCIIVQLLRNLLDIDLTTRDINQVAGQLAVARSSSCGPPHIADQHRLSCHKTLNDAQRAFARKVVGVFPCQRPHSNHYVLAKPNRRT